MVRLSYLSGYYDGLAQPSLTHSLTNIYGGHYGE